MQGERDEVVDWVEEERSVQAKRITAACRVEEVLGRTGRDEVPGTGELGVEVFLDRLNSALSATFSRWEGKTHVDCALELLRYCPPRYRRRKAPRARKASASTLKYAGRKENIFHLYSSPE
jgi:hypothetical protein